MKKIGIVGGVAWRSTLDYYAEICRRTERWHLAQNLPGAPPSPEMSIESLDLSKAVSYLGIDGDEDSWSRFDEYHRAALQRLEASGAPVISIFDVVAKESARIGAREVLILGTALTMTSPKFREEFAKYGVRAAGPRDEAARTMTAGVIKDLQLGKLEGAAERLARIAKISMERQFEAQPVVCLACTELPLAFQGRRMLETFEHDGVLYINSTAVHIAAAIDFAVDNRS